MVAPPNNLQPSGRRAFHPHCVGSCIWPCDPTLNLSLNRGIILVQKSINQVDPKSYKVPMILIGKSQNDQLGLSNLTCIVSYKAPIKIHAKLQDPFHLRPLTERHSAAPMCLVSKLHWNTPSSGLGQSTLSRLRTGCDRTGLGSQSRKPSCRFWGDEKLTGSE